MKTNYHKYFICVPTSISEIFRFCLIYRYIPCTRRMCPMMCCTCLIFCIIRRVCHMIYHTCEIFCSIRRTCRFILVHMWRLYVYVSNVDFSPDSLNSIYSLVSFRRAPPLRLISSSDLASSLRTQRGACAALGPPSTTTHTRIY